MKILILLPALLLSMFTFPQNDIKFHNSNQVPRELIMLVQCLWDKSSGTNLQVEIASELNSLNGSLNFISPQSSNFIIKGEIYKFLLERPFFSSEISMYPLVQPIDYAKSLEDLKNIPTSYCQFNKWVIKAIASDLKQIVDSKAVDQYYQQRKSQNSENLRKLMAINKYMGPWLTAFKNLQPHTIEQITISHYMELLKHISAVIGLYQAFTEPHHSEAKTFFKIPALKPSTSSLIQNTSIDDFINKVPDEQLRLDNKIDNLFKDLKQAQ